MEFIRVETDGGIAVVTYDRPPANAFNSKAKKEVAAVFQDLSRNTEVRAIIFITAGKKFYTGGSDVNDFSDITRESFIEYQAVDALMYESIKSCCAPVILAVEGYIAGLGFVIADAADIIVAANNAQFLFPEIHVGIVGGISALTNLFPKGMARYLAYTGKPVDAKDLVQYGTVFCVTEPDKVLEKCIEIAKGIAASYPKAVKYYKAAFNYSQTDIRQPIHEALFQQYTLDLVDDPERVQMVKAFLSRNKER
jgi:enoyl-CoA hydratase